MDRERKASIGRAKRELSLVNVLTAGLLVAAVASAGLPPAFACGWWGDGEGDDNEAIVIGADGQPVSEAKPANDHSSGQAGGPAMGHARGPAAPNGLEVPAPRSGYGIVVRWDGSAVPYLDAVRGRPVYSIQQLRRAGFSAVIDLGTAPTVAALHRRETEALGMKYFNIPIDGDVPGKMHVARFSEILSDNGNLPILVFSASTDLLGGMWAIYRLTEGSTPEGAVKEGRELGLSESGARDLKKRARY